MLCPLFLCAFCCFACFAKCKSSVTFFACCFLLAFGLCLFVRFVAFPAPIMLLCLRLLFASIISWHSPFPPVFFLPFYIFFATFKLFTGFAGLLCVSCCVVSVVLLGPCSCLVWFFGVLSLIMYQFGNLYFLLCCSCCFCCLLGSVCSVGFFLLLPSVIMRVRIWPPVTSCVPPHTILFPLCTTLSLYVLSNPCVTICALLGRAHMVMTVIVFVCVFVCLLPVLCVCVHACVWACW